MKKRIALVVDVENWAFYNIAMQIEKRLNSFYDFKIIPMSNIKENIVLCMLLCQTCDLVHFFWRGYIELFNTTFTKEYIKSLGMTEEDFYHKFIENKIITTAIYDHLFLTGEDLEMTKRIISFSDFYYTSSHKLFKLYNKIKGVKKPNCVITDGVDLDCFYPINLERFSDLNNRKLIIGWVGNSKWGEDGEDFKGVNTIIKPAIDALKLEGYNVDAYFADRNVKMIPHYEMNNYYASIDIYICASINEGTPNPILESMACGVPIITTDVGIVKEAFGRKQSKYILKERTVESLKTVIKKLVEEKKVLAELSIENLERIKDWSWANKTKEFHNFFEMCLKEKKND
ncbi:MAG TPA: glycosyltransferase family 4 protein [Gallicola sp.]|nr:glycosyltransferase family 4 protein [Gallicola sp.]